MWSQARSITDPVSSFEVARAQHERSLLRSNGIVTVSTRPPELKIVLHRPNLLGKTLLGPWFDAQSSSTPILAKAASAPLRHLKVAEGSLLIKVST